MTAGQIVQADLTWFNGRFIPDLQVSIDRDGRIADVGNLTSAPTVRLSGRGLLPGMVNAHSHGFQRALRGRGEHFPAGAGDFWSWRQAMYGLVASLDPDTLYRLCLATYREMLRAGITCVGEFHYLHHDGEDDFAFDAVVLQAAHDAGIRIVLLETLYAAGGIGKPLEPAQQRFRTPSLKTFWRQVDALASQLASPAQSIGVAAHSLRAVPLEALGPLYTEAVRRGLPFHVHLEEQRGEIEQCIAAYGHRPMDLLLDTLEGAHGVTAIHCTHTPAADLERFRDAGGRLCVCPLTEGNLGDGIPDLSPYATEPHHVSLGTDSNARISLIEEMRWLEYGQRWRTGTRGVLTDNDGAAASRLLAAATVAGARTLNVDTGRIGAGAWADLFAVDLAALPLRGLSAGDLMAGLVFGAGDDVITDVCVGGRWCATGRPPDDPTGGSAT